MRRRIAASGAGGRAVALGAALWALAAPALAQEPSRAELERRILRSLYAGGDASGDVASWRGAPGARTPPVPQSRAASELKRALGALAPALTAVTEGRSGSESGLLRAWEAARAADMIARARFRSVERRLALGGAGAQALSRLALAERVYLEASDALFEPLAESMAALRAALAEERPLDAATQAALRAAAARTLPGLAPLLGGPSEPTLRSSLLPYRRGRLAPRALALEPTIQPSYQNPADVAPEAADLAPDADAPLSEAVLRQADVLGHDYVRIFEFVRNEIDTEWYAGAMKGADGTLLQRSGNDVDQASLLIALLRASQAPARYVHGVVELPLESLADDLGVAPGQVAAALDRAGMAHASVIRGGRVAAMRLEHTWVAAHVPYTNYRGAVVDFSGKTWLPLLPAIKRYSRTPAAGVLERAGLSLAALVDEYLASPQLEEPLAIVRGRVAAFLEREAAGESYEQQLATEQLVPEALGYLPSSLPVAVAAVTGESAALDDARRHRVRLVVRAGEGESDPVLLDLTVPLARLLGRRVTLSYQPATVDDHTTVNLFGGLDVVPLYLIGLRPQIMIGGQRAAVAQQTTEPGVLQRFEVELLGPNGSELVGQSVRSGGYNALAFTAQRDDAVPELEDDPADSENAAARLLSQTALGYSRRWSEAERELARLAGVTLLRPSPALAIVGNAVRVETAFGLPFELDWQGVTLDAALRVAEPLTPGGAEQPARDWLRFSALQGSALEHRVFEERFLVESISADKGLALARDAGSEVLRVTQADVDAALPLLAAHPAAVLVEIESAARLGRVLDVPLSPISLNAWTGSVWRAEDPASGAGGYFISGALAGGQTSEPPGSWVLDFVADALSSPYTAEANGDPLAGVEIVKLGASDGQTGTVDEELPTRLAVLVRDRVGRPVKSAPVTFAATAGGGTLVDEQGAEGPAITTLTDERGIAAVRLRLGKLTEDDPIYFRRNPGDEFVTLALFNQVEAIGLSAQGALTLDAPFEAIGLPDEPDRLRRTDSAPTSAPSGVWADTMNIRVEDQHGNPISNAAVTFSVGAAQPFCDPPPADLQNAVVFDSRADGFGIGGCPLQPVLGECGSPSVTTRTSIRGAPAGVILGNANGTRYSVGVSASGTAPLSFSYDTSSICNPGPRVVTTTSFVTNELGRNINAAKVGETFPRPVPVTLLYSVPDYEVRVNAEGKFFIFHLPTRRWQRTTGNVTFNVGNGGSSSGTEFVGNGTYQARVTTGPAPGINPVSFEATDVLTVENMVNADTGEEFEGTRFRTASGVLADVFGVDPRIEEVSPDPLILTQAGRASEEVVVRYRIQPGSYEGATTDVDLREDGELAGIAIGSSHSGQGQVTLQRGLEFDLEKDYEAELVLNRGSVAEMKSEPMRVPLRQQIFANVNRSVSLFQEVDLLNERACTIGSLFEYTLTQDATVTLEFFKLESENTDGSLNYSDSGVTLIDEELQTEGDQELAILPSDLLPGDYRFELRGVSEVDGHDETVNGGARSEFKTRDSLPVGHVVVKGVDLFDGHMVLGREDFKLQGRGVPVGFARHYTSNAGKEPGPMGVGWSHSLGSEVVVTRCGEAIVVGGQGSGQRFVDDGMGGLRPLKGHHGSLVANPVDGSFDFYAKNGSRDHFVKARGLRWRIEWSADANGNMTRYLYDERAEESKLVSVIDAAGRVLTLNHERISFKLFSAEVITSVAGPEGLLASFEYDEYGNLVRASREGGIQVERYVYATPPAFPIDQRHRLIAAVNEINGSTTSYSYGEAPIGIQGGIQVPSLFVTQLVEPEGGSTAFSYDLASLGNRGPPTLTARVTDQRSQVTRYTLNQYGSPLEIVDPEGNRGTMIWASDDVVMVSSTDGNGATTTFSYDEHANLLSESIDITHFDGSRETFTETRTWWPPSSFDPPYIKNRVRTATNRNGATTSFRYDSRGNLLEERISVETIDGSASYTTTHSYDPRGDRRSTRDPRGATTFFSYDAYGNLATVTNPLGGGTESVWNVRGHLLRQTDALDRVTVMEYDSLGRRLRRANPGGEVELTSYDDVGLVVTETDPEGRSTATTSDREGRPVLIVNPEGGRKVFGYDAAGNKILESTWHDGATPRFDTTFAYDLTGRLVRRTEPLGRVTEYAYDGNGNVTRETLRDAGDASFEPRVTRSRYDGLNRRIETAREIGGTAAVTRTRLDGEGNKVLELDPRDRATSWRYDGLNRVIEQAEPLGKVTRLLYDGNGNVLEERRLNPPSATQTRRTDYDTLNRPTRRRDANGFATVFEYDAVGNVTRRVDPRLNLTEVDYDPRDRVIRTTRHLNRVTTPSRRVVTGFAYDKAGNLLRTILPNGNEIVQSYDGLDRVIEERDSLGPLATFRYDARGNVVRDTDAEGNATQGVYDPLDRLVEERRPEGRTVRASYDVAGNKTSQTDGRGNTSRKEYDALDRLVRVTDPSPSAFSASFAYDLAGNTLSETDRRGNTTTLAYDDLNRAVRVTAPAPLGFVQQFSYDALGNRLSTTDRRGILTTLAYDRENRLLRSVLDGVVTLVNEYDQNGNLRFATDAEGNITGFEYDERNLLIAENRPLAAITRFVRDDMGDAAEKRDPEGRVTRREYDPRRRISAETNGAGDRSEFVYDGNGNRTELRKPEGNTWQFRYDGAERLVEVADPEGGTTRHGYDFADNRISTLDANGNPTSFSYDERHRLTVVEQADGAREETDYDPNGNVRERRDALGQVTRFEYDALDRETLRSFSDTAVPTGDDLESIAVEYDPNGNALGITERYGGATGTRVTARSWDSFDRLSTTTDAQGETIRYAYDANGNRARITDPDGRVTSYLYDALNRAESVTASGSGVTEYGYFRNSQLREIRYPNGSAARYEYDQANRVTRIENTQNSALVSEYRYVFDLNGNRIEQVETNGGAAETTGYDYDDADRLREVVYPDKTTTYSYDGVGNRLTETERDAVGTMLTDKGYDYDSRSRLVEVRDNLDPLQNVVYGSDANGNQVSKTRAGVTTDFSYDVRDQLQSVTEGGAPLGLFRYDYQGLRIRKESPSGVLRYVYDDQSVLLQTDEAGSTIAKYDYGPDRLLSLAHVSQPRQYYLFDGLRSVANLVRSDGAIQARYRYDAWGNPRGTAGSSFNPFGFTGQERDDATGLYYFKARFYDPETGRFLSEDPAEGEPDDPPSLHRYLYAKSNPTVFIDPTGRWVESVWDAASLGIGLVSLVNSIRDGRFGDAALDAVGVVVDAVALALPIVPGGAGVAIKAARAAKAGVDVAQATKTAVRVDRAVDVLQAADGAVSAYQGATAAKEEFQEGNLGWGTFNAAMSVVGARRAVVKTKGLTRSPPSAPTPRTAPTRAEVPVETKPQGRISGEGAAGGTDAAASVNRQSARAETGDARAPSGQRAVDSPGRGPETAPPRKVQPEPKVREVLEPPKKGRAGEYEDAAPGASSDIATRKRIVPALEFENPNPRGRPFVKFDAIDPNDATIFIDRKLNGTTFPKQIKDVQRVAEALSQNPSASLRLEVPTEAARRAVLRLLEKAGEIDNPQILLKIVEFE